MVDELDPILETKLRLALREEADALPFTIRTAELQRAAAARAAARRYRRFSILAAAAVVVVAVVGVTAIANMRGPSGPAATSALDGLPSFERLAEAGSGGPTIYRVEDTAGALPSQWQYGLLAGAYNDLVLVACTGPSSLTVALEYGSPHSIPLGTVTCDGGIRRMAWDGTQERAVLASSSVSLVLNTEPGVSWRMLVVDDMTGRILQHVGVQSTPVRVPSMDYLFAQRTAGSTELARGSGMNESNVTSTAVLSGLGDAASIEILFSCSTGDPVTLSFGTSGTVGAEGGTPAPCDGTMQSSLFQRDTKPVVNEAHLLVPVGTAWEAIAFAVPGYAINGAPWTPDANGLAPYAQLEALLAGAGDGAPTMWAEHPAAEAGDAVRTWVVGRVAARQVHAAVSCSSGTVTVGLASGSTVAVSTGVSCAETPTEVSLPGGGASSSPLQLVVTALPSVRWRIVGMDGTASGSPQP